MFSMRQKREIADKVQKVEYWDDERSSGNSIIVTLKYGWCFEDQSEHVLGFDTVAEAKEAVKISTKCRCIECVKSESGN